MNSMEKGTIHGMVIGGSSARAATTAQVEADTGLRRGPWSVEEDLVLVNYIAVHGEGRWNSLARSAGLKRSGKSCRLRWLNYLRPDVRRGNFTPEEQLLILELHSRWGNRWSKIALQLPGRTDNEIKNYWRTRVQKHAKLIKCDVNSQQFKDAMRLLWMPRLMERRQAASMSTGAASGASSYSAAGDCVGINDPTTNTIPSTYVVSSVGVPETIQHAAAGVLDTVSCVSLQPDDHSFITSGLSSDSSLGDCSLPSPQLSNLTANYYVAGGCSSSGEHSDQFASSHTLISGIGGCSGSPLSPYTSYDVGAAQEFPEFKQLNMWEPTWSFPSDSLWDFDDIWFPQQQLQVRDM